MALKHSLLVAAALAVTLPTLPASADETGLASMHDWVRIGRKVCYAEHTHYASSNGHRSKRAALNAAIKDWQEFTAFEYGTSWAYFRRASAKRRACSRQASGWSCSIQARPCKRR
jgi:hypothetical protein